MAPQQKSLKTKLILWLVFMISAVMLSYFSFTLYSAYEENLTELKARGRQMTEMQAMALSPPLWDLNTDHINVLLKSLSKDADFKGALVYDPDGKTLSSVGNTIAGLSDVRFRREIVHTSATGEDSEIIGNFELILSLENLYSQEKKSLLLAVVTFFITTIGTILTVMFALNRIVITPLSHIMQGIEKTSKGDLDHSLHINSDDEFSILAESFNGMTATLKQTYEEITQAQAKAEEASKVKSQFLANMSHELRTPLNAIIGYSEMLREELEDMGQTPLISDVDKIAWSGKHLLEIISDILDFSKIEAGKMELHYETFDLDSMIKNIAAVIEPAIQKNKNQLDIYLEGNLSKMESDFTKVKQNLLNLLSNSAKFTSQGVVSLHVSSTIKEGVGFVIFQVKDTGIGMTQEQQEKLFQPFSQADASTTRKFGGTGLGLSIVQEYCRMLGGTIRSESTPGQGSTFIMSLPQSRPISPTETTQAVPS